MVLLSLRRRSCRRRRCSYLPADPHFQQTFDGEDFSVSTTQNVPAYAADVLITKHSDERVYGSCGRDCWLFLFVFRVDVV